MKPYYLRFPDAATGEKALAEAFPKGDTGLDVIGESYSTTGTGKAAVTTKRSGWFANWIGEELPGALEAYLVRPQPVTPFRVFAGWHPDEIAAREVKQRGI